MYLTNHVSFHAKTATMVSTACGWKLQWHFLFRCGAASHPDAASSSHKLQAYLPIIAG